MRISPKSFSLRLRAARKAMGVSRRGMVMRAMKAHSIDTIGEWDLSRWEALQSGVIPRGAVLGDVAKMYELSLDALFGTEEEFQAWLKQKKQIEKEKVLCGTNLEGRGSKLT